MSPPSGHRNPGGAQSTVRGDPILAASALPLAGARPGGMDSSRRGDLSRECSSALTPHSLSQKVVTALDRTWHPEHFFCAQCGAFFGPEGTTAGSLAAPGASGGGFADVGQGSASRP